MPPECFLPEIKPAIWASAPTGNGTRNLSVDGMMPNQDQPGPLYTLFLLKSIVTATMWPHKALFSRHVRTGVSEDTSVNILPLHVTGYQCSLSHGDRAVTAFNLTRSENQFYINQGTHPKVLFPGTTCSTNVCLNGVLPSEKQEIWERHACGISQDNWTVWRSL